MFCKSIPICPVLFVSTPFMETQGYPFIFMPSCVVFRALILLRSTPPGCKHGGATGAGLRFAGTGTGGWVFASLADASTVGAGSEGDFFFTR